MQTSPEPGPALMVYRVARRAVAWLLCAALLGGAGWVGAARAAGAEPTPSASAQPADSVKYYIVGATGTLEREYLFQIAALTLGDGRRYMEIFELNEGRLQPDGQRLEDPLVLMPGWVLILPADADGPGVLFGPPPVFVSAQDPPPRTSAPAPPQSADGVVVAALVLVALILSVALLVWRPRRRVAPTGAPAVAPTEAPAVAPTPLTTSRVGLGLGDRPRPAPAPAREGTAPAAVPPVPAVAGSAVPPVPAVAGSAVPPVPADPASARVETSLRAGRDVLTVSLVGARPDLRTGVRSRGSSGAQPSGAQPAGNSGPRRSEGAVVRLGEAGPDALWVDLAASPDVVTITGSRAGVRRQCEELARQLSRAQVPTVAVGDVPGVTDQIVASLRELSDGFGLAQLLVVFLHDVPPTDVAVLHELIARRRPRVIPVAVGSGPRSRWWIDVV